MYIKVYLHVWIFNVSQKLLKVIFEKNSNKFLEYIEKLMYFLVMNHEFRIMVDLIFDIGICETVDLLFTHVVFDLSLIFIKH